MTITTGRFGVDQKTKQVTEYVPPNVIPVGEANLPVPPQGPPGTPPVLPPTPEPEPDE